MVVGLRLRSERGERDRVKLERSDFLLVGLCLVSDPLKICEA